MRPSLPRGRGGNLAFSATAQRVVAGFQNQQLVHQILEIQLPVLVNNLVKILGQQLFFALDLVATGKVRPEEVLGLTFTTKAAAELRQRVTAALGAAGLLDRSVVAEGEDVLEPTVSTYHAYAANLLTDHGLRIGHEPDTRVVSDASRYQLGARVIERFTGHIELLTDHPATAIQNLLALDGAMSEHLVDADDVRRVDEEARRGFERALAEEQAGKARKTYLEPPAKAINAIDRRAELLQLVTGYRRLKADLGLMDFGDQIALAARLVEDWLGPEATLRHTVRIPAGTPLRLDIPVDETFRIRVDTVAQMFDVAQVLAFQPLPAGRRVAIVGNSDALGLLATDAAASAGLVVSKQVELGADAGAEDGVPRGDDDHVAHAESRFGCGRTFLHGADHRAAHGRQRLRPALQDGKRRGGREAGLAPVAGFPCLDRARQVDHVAFADEDARSRLALGVREIQQPEVAHGSSR